jgi:hypothetical protein
MGLFSIFWERAPSQESAPTSFRSVRHSAEHSGFGEIAGLHSLMTALATLDTAGTPAKIAKSLEIS